MIVTDRRTQWTDVATTLDTPNLVPNSKESLADRRRSEMSVDVRINHHRSKERRWLWL